MLPCVRNRTEEAGLHTSSRCSAALLAICTAASAHAFPVRQGVELQVNEFTPNAQAAASAAMESNGDFVVVWRSYLQDGYQLGVFAKRFDSAGAMLALEFQVNTQTGRFEYGSVIASDADGDFVVVWHSFGQDGSGPGIFLQRYDSSGARLGVDFQVNTRTLNTQRFATVAMDADADFVVAWQSQYQDGDSYGIFARRFDAAGVPQAVEFQVNSWTTGHQGFPTAAMEDGGGFVLIWHSAGQDGSETGVFGQRFAATGSAQGSEFQVNTYTTGDQGYAALAIDADGDFVVAWDSAFQDASGTGVFARRFGSAGEALGSEFQVSAYTFAQQFHSVAAMDTNGDFVVAWTADLPGGSGHEISAQAFTRAGLRVGPELQVNSFTLASQEFFTAPRPSGAAMDADGDFLIVWESASQDGGERGVFAQRFGSLAGLDVDGNGSIGPLTDGLLILRHFFGFTGSTLVASAVDQGGCTRCTAGEIAAYLASVGNLLDVDGSGALGPLTDGLLVLRHLFGFTGATLTTGAVDAMNCTRCVEGTIAPHLDSLAD